MKRLIIIAILSLISFLTFSQGLPNGCNSSSSSINTVFYPNTTVYYNNNNIYQENLYLCGPNTIIYDTATNTNNCRTVFLNANTKYYTNNTGCGMNNSILAKNNSTVVIMPGGNLMRIWYEPNAIIIDQTSGSGTVTYSCSFISFPNINCSATSIKENNFSNDLEIYPNPANDKLSVKFSSNGKEIVKLQIINSIGQVVKEIDLNYNTTQISTEDLPNGIYLFSVKNQNSSVDRKYFVISR